MTALGAAINLLATLWALPWTAIGLAAGALGLLTGGKVQRAGGALEFHGGAVAWLLERLPNGPLAMTLGQVILGRSAAALALSRDHEMVHVRQYRRWGPLFVPAYLLCSLRAWLAGKSPYRDNRFEQEAFGEQSASRGR